MKFNSDMATSSVLKIPEILNIGTGKSYSINIPAHNTPIKNLLLANTTQIYPEDRGTNYSIRMGKEIAEKLNKT